MLRVDDVRTPVTNGLDERGHRLCFETISSGPRASKGGMDEHLMAVETKTPSRHERTHDTHLAVARATGAGRSCDGMNGGSGVDARSERIEMSHWLLSMEVS